MVRSDKEGRVTLARPRVSIPCSSWVVSKLGGPSTIVVPTLVRR